MAGSCYIDGYRSPWHWSDRDRNPGAMGTDMDRCIYGRPVTRGTVFAPGAPGGLATAKGTEEVLFSFLRHQDVIEIVVTVDLVVIEACLVVMVADLAVGIYAVDEIDLGALAIGLLKNLIQPEAGGTLDR